MFAIHIDSVLRPDEVRARLARVVGPRVRNQSATATLRPLVGRLEAASFRVRRRIARRALWQSTLDGRLTATEAGTRIDLELPLAAPVVVLASIAVGGVLHGQPALLALLALIAVMAAATIGYDALRVVSIIRNAVVVTRPPEPEPERQPLPPASHSERKIA
jgi:hypothetical protein